MEALDEQRCPVCGGPLTYEVVKYAKVAGRTVAVIPSADELAMCVRCVALVLCMATVVKHGDVGDRPQSHNFPGHEQRMQAHEEHMRRRRARDVEAKREEPAAAPA